MLLNALPRVLEAFPDALVLHAGPYQGIIGEEAYAARLAPLFEKYAAHYRLLGTLGGAELTAFYRNLDVLCICSLNSTESFGLVQIEAMRNGVPVAACNPVSYTHLRAHETVLDLVCRLLLEKNNTTVTAAA